MGLAASVGDMYICSAMMSRLSPLHAQSHLKRTRAARPSASSLDVVLRDLHHTPQEHLPKKTARKQPKQAWIKGVQNQKPKTTTTTTTTINRKSTQYTSRVFVTDGGVMAPSIAPWCHQKEEWCHRKEEKAKLLNKQKLEAKLEAWTIQTTPRNNSDNSDNKQLKQHQTP